VTFGIDISTHQVLLDVDFAVAAGTEFAGSKSVASYLPNLTVAADYHSNIDDIIEAGLDHAKFHYAVPNSRNTPEVTAQFQWDIRYRAQPTDAYMLDDEPLDDYGTYWRDDPAAAYFEKLHSLGARYDQMWFYCPAALTRASGPWPKMLALRAKGLKIMWVSYGDMDAILEPGEEPYVGNTGFTDPELHQFTSAWTVPGYTGRIDRIYSRLSVAQLFKGGTMTFEDKFREYARLYPKPSTGEASWDQMCGNLMNRFGLFTTPNDWHPTRTGPTAWDVALASGPRNMNPAAAPIGAIHWWRNKSGNTPGHTGVDLTGGGQNVGMATYAVRESLGAAIGIQSVAGYSAAKTFMAYEGWTNNYAGARHSLAATAGGGYTPIEEEEDMSAKLYQRKGDGRVHAISIATGFDYHVPSEAYRDLLLGWKIFDDGAPPIILADNIFDYVRELAASARVPAAAVDVDALAAKVAALVTIPAGSLTEAQVEAAVRRVFSDAGTV